MAEHEQGIQNRGTDVVVNCVFIRHARRFEDRYHEDGHVEWAPLTEAGFAEAYEAGQRLRERYPGYRMLRPVSSPIIRAVQTAEQLLTGYHNDSRVQNFPTTDRLFVSQLTRNLWEELGIHHTDLTRQDEYETRTFPTLEGRTLKDILAAGMLNFVQRQRRMAARIPRGSRFLKPMVTHDFMLESLVSAVSTEDHLTQMLTDGRVRMPYLSTFEVIISRDPQGIESLGVLWQEQELTYDPQRVEYLRNHHTDLVNAHRHRTQEPYFIRRPDRNIDG